MRTPVSLSEIATVNSTGDQVTVLRRRTFAHDEQIMRALELAGHFVIGTPQGFRYRRNNRKRFTRPEPSSVFIIDSEGKATATLPGPYFQAHYTIVEGDAQ